MNELNIAQTNRGNTKYTAQHHQGVVNAIVSSLTAPDQPTTVSLQYSNDKNMATEIQASLCQTIRTQLDLLCERFGSFHWKKH